MKKYIASALLLFACFSYAQAEGDVDPTGTTSTCVNIQVNLRKGSKDLTTNGAVSDLQGFLQDQGLLTSEPTGYFGGLTFNAVNAFQVKYGIVPASGYVGTLTRAKIQSLTCTTGTTTTVATSTTQTNVVPVLAHLSSVMGDYTTTNVVTSATPFYFASGANVKNLALQGGVARLTFKNNANTATVYTLSSFVLYDSYDGVAFDLKGSSLPVGTYTVTIGNDLVQSAPVQLSVVAAATSISCTVGTATAAGTCTTSTATQNNGSIYLSVSNSASGPFVTNGSVYAAASVYSRINNVLTKQSSSSNTSGTVVLPYGCSQPSGSTKCLDVSAFRAFTQSEILDASTIQTVITDGSGFPAGSYDTYLVYPGGTPFKIGSFTLLSGAPAGGAISVQASVSPTTIVSGSTFTELKYAATNAVYCDWYRNGVKLGDHVATSYTWNASTSAGPYTTTTTWRFVCYNTAGQSAENSTTLTVTSGTLPVTTSGVVPALFTLALGRDATAADIAYYQGKLSSGSSLSDVAWELFTSTEGQVKNGNLTAMFNEGYVEFLYNKLLGRPSDLAGKSYYVNALLNGSKIKKAVFDELFNSTESRLKNVSIFPPIVYY